LGTNWTIRVKGSSLDDKYIWLRFDGFAKFALNLLREAFQEYKLTLANAIWNPKGDLFALIIIRRETRVEGWSTQQEMLHAIVDLDAETVQLVGDWTEPFDRTKSWAGTYKLTDTSFG